MKQKGSVWLDPQGLQVPVKRISDYEKLSEHFGQQIASEAEMIEARVTSAKKLFQSKCEEMYMRKKATGYQGKQITFYTFDYGYRIEYIATNGDIRIYRRVSEKDFVRMNMDFSAVKEIASSQLAQETMLNGNKVAAADRNGVRDDDSIGDYVRKHPKVSKTETLELNPDALSDQAEEEASMAILSPSRDSIMSQEDYENQLAPSVQDRPVDEEKLTPEERESLPVGETPWPITKDDNEIPGMSATRKD